jgi:hypothetical protein
MTTTQQRPSHLDTVLTLIDEALVDYERSRAADFLSSLPYDLQETSR